MYIWETGPVDTADEKMKTIIDEGAADFCGKLDGKYLMKAVSFAAAHSLPCLYQSRTLSGKAIHRP